MCLFWGEGTPVMKILAMKQHKCLDYMSLLTNSCYINGRKYLLGLIF